MTVRNAAHVPVPAASLPDFAPIPLQKRHDGWTPERQKAFVEALADTGCVSIACRMVNMSQRSFYQLRRQPGAEGFRAAAEAAQALGLQVVKDEAFERAMTGELIPVFVAGKLLGFRRKKNDRLLMFILRHYGQDAAGRRTTINYFSTRATASAGAEAPSGRRQTRSGAPTSARDAGSGRPATGEAVSFDVTNSVRDGPSALAAAESSTTTVKTIISGNPGQSTTLARADEAAALLASFEGADLDEQARAQILASLAACAERRRALRTDWSTPRPERLERQAADPECDFIRLPPNGFEWLGTLESGVETDDFEPYDEDEPHWESIGEEKPQWFVEWEEREAARVAAKALPSAGPDQSAPGVPGEGDHVEHGGGVGAEADEPSLTPEDLIPSPPPAPKSIRPYKKRTPKQPFTPWTGQAGPELIEEATAQAEADRTAAAAREARRRERSRVRSTEAKANGK
jgi:hypothetical protein